MKKEDDLANHAAHYKWLAEIARLKASILDLASATAQAAIGMQRLSNALAPFEPWPEVVLEDILDAEYITDQNSGG